MKKTILRKLYILMLAAAPAVAAGNISAAAAEINTSASAIEEAELSEGEEAEETMLPEAAEEEEPQEETSLPQDGNETELPEETSLPQDGNEAELPEEISLPNGKNETELPDEAGLPQDGDEEKIPENTETVKTGEETVLPEETELADGEKEIAAPTETEDVNSAEAGSEIGGEEKQISNVGAAEILKSGIKAQMVDCIHYITLNDTDAASDSILIESGGHYGLVDASHPSWDPDSRITGYTADVDDVINYLHMVGVMHLDFVLGTHSHSDHIGGMKFLASALNSEGDYWIDSNTVYYYKQQHYNQLEEEDWGWQNSRMFRQSVEAMKARGAIMVETGAHNEEALQKANAQFVEGKSGPVSDTIEFMIGNFAVSLFNLYHNSSDNENLNSIVTAVRKDDRTSLLMGDLEMEDGYERRVADAVAAKYGNADVVKLGHHGYNQCTSSDTLRTLNPSYVVTTSNRTGSFYDDEPPYNYFLAHRGITAYRVAENYPALVEDLSGDEIRFLTYNISGELTEKPVEWKGRMTPGWKKWNRDDGTYDYIFVHKNGNAATGWNWLPRNGVENWYLFDQDGVNLKGFQKSGQDIYYLSYRGEMLTGWQQVSSKWYYMNGNGAMQTGWQLVDGSWYYMNGSGAMQTGWQLVDGSWYYMNGSGAMQTGWQLVDGCWYYMNGSGAMQTGWQLVDGYWYYMNGSGVMQTGWQLVDGCWYYMNGSGVMQTGWHKINGKWYFMNESGVMQTGWQIYGGKWYYMDKDGAMQTGWQLVDGSWYYMNGDGVMQTGWQKIGGTWYHLRYDGVWISG